MESLYDIPNNTIGFESVLILFDCSPACAVVILDKAYSKAVGFAIHVRVQVHATRAKIEDPRTFLSIWRG